MRGRLVALLFAIAALGCGGGASDVCSRRCDKETACRGEGPAVAAMCKQSAACPEQSANPGKCPADNFTRYWDCHDNCLRVADCYAYQKCVGGCAKSCAQ